MFCMPSQGKALFVTETGIHLGECMACFNISFIDLSGKASKQRSIKKVNCAFAALESGFGTKALFVHHLDSHFKNIHPSTSTSSPNQI